MPGVLENFKVTVEPNRAYLTILCFMKDSIIEGNDGNKVIKLDLSENSPEIIHSF